MAGHIGFLTASELYDFLYRGVAVSIGATLYMRLLVSPSTRSGGGTETNYGTYARLALVRNTSIFGVTANGRITNIVTLQYSSPTTLGNGNLVFFDIVDTASGAFTKIYNAGPLLPAKAVQVGKPPRFAPGHLVLSM